MYKMTELYFIQDQSDDHKSTWKFLQQRVEEAVQLQRILHDAGISPKIALDTISATFDAVSSCTRITAPFRPFANKQYNFLYLLFLAFYVFRHGASFELDNGLLILHSELQDLRLVKIHLVQI